MKWQRAQRLVGSADPDWIVTHLFIDSLLFISLVPATARSLLDIGSGAGVPGIPIKVVRPDLELVLVESRRRRASFLMSVIRELELRGAAVINERAERLAAQPGRRFDAVLMRCAGDPAELFPVAAALAAPSGVVIASGPPGEQPTKRLPPGAERVTVRAPGGRSRTFLRLTGPLPPGGQCLS